MEGCVGMGPEKQKGPALLPAPAHRLRRFSLRDNFAWLCQRCHGPKSLATGRRTSAPPQWCPVPSGGWPIRASLAQRQSLPTRAVPAWRFRDCLLVLGFGLLLDPKDLLLSVAALLANAV